MTQPQINNRVLIVIGPGRSGTSALTRGLAALGADLGDNLKPATPKNALGYFEDLDILDLNHRLQQAFGLKSNGSSLTLLEDSAWRAVDLKPFQHQLAAIVQQRFADKPLWAFKSGGVMRLLPFWEQTLSGLGIDISYVLAIRNPLNVASSRARLNAIRGAQERSDLEWLVRVVPYFRHVLARPMVVVDYDQLMTDAGHELRRIARRFAIDVDNALEAEIAQYANEFLRADLRHNRADLSAFAENSQINPLTRDAYLWLNKLATDQIETDDRLFLADWARIEQGLELYRPLLKHIDALDSQIKGPRWGVGGFWQTAKNYLPLPALAR